MAPKTLTHEEKIQGAKRKAEEMKAKALAKRAAWEAAQAAAPPRTTDPQDEKFLLGEHNLVLIDWDDTLFPTSDWKNRIQESAARPPRADKIQALSEAISTFIRKLKQFGEVKIVTHGTKSWYEHSSKVLLPETKALLDTLDHRYRDSHGQKYMRQKPAGEKYTTDIGVQVDNYGEWFKTDQFFYFISEKKAPKKWDEAHLPEKVLLPRQVLIIGDGQAEKRSYDEHGNQARVYASQPGHAAVAHVGLKGVFLKDGPSYDELVLQMRWATAHVESTFLPPSDFRTMLWDLTGFPDWICSLKVGANAYQPLGRGSLICDASRVVPMELDLPMADGEEDIEALQLALAMSMSQSGDNAAAATAAAPTTPPVPNAGAEAQIAAEAAADEEEQALQEAIALSLR
mmetsp:Transcript_22817/g.37810  ORF Transcript_22817/g.37810 Transcript_22817/m.37810 type:complete len:400 (+) Transcript_22817:50-1249(+)|eukprot:CAMPEP_0119307786 /NCGR_PEP_ID=MMETSP1333-20130426/8138_1 /TAXON_ID=418940 /ORGANISM="Scyphosphaera apsteinii, Strain RCC1455" /LENGTH=399 /DNA_ID=CAMNT_0007311401 /DNA_START=37 /DNA_END=1236 /DNA_ORIENTATION=+